MSAPSPALFEPLKLNSKLTLKNRIIVSPMCQYSAEDGLLNEWHLVHLGSMATHGCDTICVEATGVQANGRITPGCTGIWSDAHIEGHKRVVDFVRKYSSSVIGIQIGHAGRKASSQRPFVTGGKHTLLAEEKDGGWPDNIVAPSAIPWDGASGKPKELTLDQIKELVKAFGDAAVRALRAGYDFIEIHSAHGYLLHQFLSPLTNKRNDIYGGSFENRTRAVKEVAAEIRRRVGQDFPLGIRFSCQDWVPEGGWTLAETVELCSQLTEAPYNLSFFDCSSGGLHPSQQFPSPLPLGYQVDFAKAVKARVGSKAAVIAVGYIVDPQQAEDIVKSGIDAVMLARQILREPSFSFRAARELGGKASTPLPYGYAIAVNPPAYKPAAAGAATVKASEAKVDCEKPCCKNKSGEAESSKPCDKPCCKKGKSSGAGGFWIHCAGAFVTAVAIGYIAGRKLKL
eukprot:TRINITY_DN2569_c0_g2_i1.p1 TRINITY_DN2569_c0_g2~~TRINITY_DN2569_c0_g2_i1.p1  ORF type:complete len:466 (-),score=115.79 TRINITY_DN2569_c0_g2_i1:70-1437(-)